MTEIEKLELYEKTKRGIMKEINLHSSPSQDTLIMVNKLNVEIAKMKEEIKNTVKAVEILIFDNKEQHKEILSKIENIICSSDNKYAEKDDLSRLEKFVSKLTWVAFAALIGFMVEVIWFLINKLWK